MRVEETPGLVGLLTRRLVRASGHSLKGLRILWREEAFRVECVLFLVLAPLSLWLGKTGLERALLLGSLLLILVVEALNTAIEAAINRISYDFHPLSGESKDLGSAAVALSILLAAAVWSLVLLG